MSVGTIVGAPPAGTFGEVTIDLMGAGILTAGDCKVFKAAFLKSRSSTSFTAELKDFVGPVTGDLICCGGIKICKADDAGTPLSGVEFKLCTDNEPFGSATTNLDGYDPGEGAGKDTVTNDIPVGCCRISDVQFGKYWIVETPATIPANHHGADPKWIEVTNAPASRRISSTRASRARSRS